MENNKVNMDEILAKEDVDSIFESYQSSNKYEAEVPEIEKDILVYKEHATKDDELGFDLNLENYEETVEKLISRNEKSKEVITVSNTTKINKHSFLKTVLTYIIELLTKLSSRF